MKVAVAVFAIALVCILGLYVAQGTARRMTRITPIETSKGWDAKRIGYRQCGATVDDGGGSPLVRTLTIIGPTRRVLPPWIDIEWSDARIAVAELGSESHSLDPNTRTIWWAGQRWHESPEEFPDLPANDDRPTVNNSIFDFLRAHAADKETLIATIQDAVEDPGESGVKQ